jgi:hypothetical protein
MALCATLGLKKPLNRSTLAAVLVFTGVLHVVLIIGAVLAMGLLRARLWAGCGFPFHRPSVHAAVRRCSHRLQHRTAQGQQRAGGILRDKLDTGRVFVTSEHQPLFRISTYDLSVRYRITRRAT